MKYKNILVIDTATTVIFRVNPYDNLFCQLERKGYQSSLQYMQS